MYFPNVYIEYVLYLQSGKQHHLHSNSCVYQHIPAVVLVDSMAVSSCLFNKLTAEFHSIAQDVSDRFAKHSGLEICGNQLRESRLPHLYAGLN